MTTALAPAGGLDTLAARPAPRRRSALRVALASDWFLPRRGGIELQLAGLAEQLAAAGHRADVLTPTPAGDDAPCHRVSSRSSTSRGRAEPSTSLIL